jgi:hypothetical protein
LIKENTNITGLDITGDYSPIILQGALKKFFSYLDHPKDIKSFKTSQAEITRRNEETNLKILASLF